MAGTVGGVRLYAARSRPWAVNAEAVSAGVLPPPDGTARLRLRAALSFGLTALVWLALLAATGTLVCLAGAVLNAIEAALDDDVAGLVGAAAG